MPVLTYLVFAGAALAEIVGCLAFWAWLHNGQTVWWTLPGVSALITFAWLSTWYQAPRLVEAMVESISWSH